MTHAGQGRRPEGQNWKCLSWHWSSREAPTMRVLYLSISNVREAGTTRALMGGARKHKQRRTYPRFHSKGLRGSRFCMHSPKSCLQGGHRVWPFTAKQR